MTGCNYPTTPDGRYFVVRGRLWRTSDRSPDPELRERLVKELMDARGAVRAAWHAADHAAEAIAHEAVDRLRISPLRAITPDEARALLDRTDGATHAGLRDRHRRRTGPAIACQRFRSNGRAYSNETGAGLTRRWCLEQGFVRGDGYHKVTI